MWWSTYFRCYYNPCPSSLLRFFLSTSTTTTVKSLFSFAFHLIQIRLIFHGKWGKWRRKTEFQSGTAEINLEFCHKYFSNIKIWLNFVVKYIYLFPFLVPARCTYRFGYVFIFGYCSYVSAMWTNKKNVRLALELNKWVLPGFTLCFKI